MLSSFETATSFADTVFFYGEHGTALFMGLYCAGRYLSYRAAEATSGWLLLISVPLIGISLIRIALFGRRKKTAALDEREFYPKPKTGVSRGPHMRESHFIRRGIR